VVSLILPFSNSRMLHLPKTGGSWFNAMLDNFHVDYYPIDPEKKCRAGHTGYYYKEHNGFSFGFIRNPYDWYKSLFKFNRLTLSNTHWEMEDINKFVLQTIGSRHNLYEQSLYFFGKNYEISYICKYENLLEDTIDALHFAGEPCNESSIADFYNIRINGTTHIECDDYSTDVKNQIFRADNFIFKRFKY
jgi:hypothetical protein